MSVYDGEKDKAPAVKDIPPLLSGFFEREISARYSRPIKREPDVPVCVCV